MPAPVGFRVLAARLLLPETAHLGQQLFDRPVNLAVVDVTSFAPKTCSAYEKQRGRDRRLTKSRRDGNSARLRVRGTIVDSDAPTDRAPSAARWPPRRQ
jgi:hypothetical protein